MLLSYSHPVSRQRWPSAMLPMGEKGRHVGLRSQRPEDCRHVPGGGGHHLPVNKDGAATLAADAGPLGGC
jgi:hypothetical protein